MEYFNLNKLFYNNQYGFRAYKEVSDRKSATQTGFKKLNYPQFNGDVLNYQEFKRRWNIEVVPERRPPALELAALKESIPALAP